ncbi:MAG: GatB/YqeY domain-containing protein [Legionellales bacterium]|nr:GatB/YqeY domain-containing protein [Legionellales bacterium]
MSALKTRLQDNIKDAMRAKDSEKLSVLRFISAAIKQREIDERIELSDAQCLEVLTKMTKQRRESIEQFSEAGRIDLADKESAELKIIESFLPEQLDLTELERIIAKTIQEEGAVSIKDMAKVMAIIRPIVMGRADMAMVSQKIKDHLASAT